VPVAPLPTVDPISHCCSAACGVAYGTAAVEGGHGSRADVRDLGRRQSVDIVNIVPAVDVLDILPHQISHTFSWRAVDIDVEKIYDSSHSVSRETRLYRAFVRAELNTEYRDCWNYWGGQRRCIHAHSSDGQQRCKAAQVS
jgi:hypothetical protein